MSKIELSISCLSLFISGVGIVAIMKNTSTLNKLKRENNENKRKIELLTEDLKYKKSQANGAEIKINDTQPLNSKKPDEKKDHAKEVIKELEVEGINCIEVVDYEKVSIESKTRYAKKMTEGLIDFKQYERLISGAYVRYVFGFDDKDIMFDKCMNLQEQLNKGLKSDYARSLLAAPLAAGLEKYYYTIREKEFKTEFAYIDELGEENIDDFKKVFKKRIVAKVSGKIIDHMNL